MSGEMDFTRKVCESLVKCNCKVIALTGSLRQEPGLPDRIVWHRFWRGFIEFKGMRTKLTKRQIAVMSELNARRTGSAFVLRAPGTLEYCKDNEVFLLEPLENPYGIELVRKLASY